MERELEEEEEVPVYLGGKKWRVHKGLANVGQSTRRGWDKRDNYKIWR